jgi:hypothetical protein
MDQIVCFTDKSAPHYKLPTLFVFLYRYIEGLHSEQKYITPWEKSLTPMPINPDPGQFNMHKLPAHWMTEEAVNGFLAQDKSLNETDIQKMDTNTKILKGLCTLRDFMMRDAVSIYKNMY